MLTNVFARLKVVLCNILKGDGGNDLVEDTRGKKGKGIKIEQILKELGGNNEEEDAGETDVHDYEYNDEQNEQGVEIQFDVEI